MIACVALVFVLKNKSWTRTHTIGLGLIVTCFVTEVIYFFSVLRPYEAVGDWEPLEAIFLRCFFGGDEMDTVILQKSETSVHFFAVHTHTHIHTHSHSHDNLFAAELWLVACTSNHVDCARVCGRIFTSVVQGDAHTPIVCRLCAIPRIVDPIFVSFAPVYFLHAEPSGRCSILPEILSNSHSFFTNEDMMLKYSSPL